MKLCGNDKKVFIIRHALKSKIKNKTYKTQILYITIQIIKQLQNNEEAITIFTWVEQEKKDTENALRRWWLTYL